jgi:hypothetical protein
LLFNAGRTPAYNLSIAAQVAILGWPLPADTDLFVSLGDNPSRATVGAIQTYRATRWLDRMLSDVELGEVKTLKGRAFYVYGRVTYWDVFGVEHYTNFCQYALWGHGGQPAESNMTERHNDAD